MLALGFGYYRISMKNLISAILHKDIDLSFGWVQYYLEKHTEISLRRGEALDRLRCKALDESSIDYYFLNLEIAIFKCEELSGKSCLNSKSHFCMDETSIKNWFPKLFNTWRKTFAGFPNFLESFRPFFESFRRRFFFVIFLLNVKLISD